MPGYVKCYCHQRLEVTTDFLVKCRDCDFEYEVKSKSFERKLPDADSNRLRTCQRNVLFLLAMKHPQGCVITEDHVATAKELEEHGYLQIRTVKDRKDNDRLQCELTAVGAAWVLASSFAPFLSEERRSKLKDL